ncbi:MAG: hypothetical protein R6U44_11195 [Archaeoglobaceae archaeon]
MKKILVLLIALLIIGCASEKDEQGGSDQQTSFKTQIAVFKDERSWKAQVTFTLPNPCHKIQFLSKETNAQKIFLNYEHTPPDPNKPCIQVIKTYNETVDLGELNEGNYTVAVMVNDQEVKRININVQNK